VWIPVVSAALLAATLTLAAERVFFDASPAPSAATPPPGYPLGAATPRPHYTVLVETPPPDPSPPPIPSDRRDIVLRDLQAQADAQRSRMHIITAERHLTLAAESLLHNDASQTERELVAATSSLNEAFALASEDLKSQISNERAEIGRMRADLQVNPRDLDQKLRQMRERLLAAGTEETQP
jgi:hypothetical protein